MSFVERASHYMLHEYLYFGNEDDENVQTVREFKTLMSFFYQIKDYRNPAEANCVLNMFKSLNNGVRHLGLTEKVAWSIIDACSPSHEDKVKQARFKKYFGIEFYIIKVLNDIVRIWT